MKIFTTYSNSEPMLSECDAFFLFSENNGLTFTQISDAVEADYYKIPVVLAHPGNNYPCCVVCTEYCSLMGAYNAIDARLVFNALVEEIGFAALEKNYFSNTSRLAGALRASGSPIETKLLLAMFVHTYLFYTEEFYTQHAIGPYRADIAIVTHGHKVVIEADGHNFHERTKEQSQHDKQRDREMQTLGWRVMRFTGSEIHKNPALCATQVQDLLHALMKGAA